MLLYDPTAAEPIDLSTWPRRNVFNLFLNFSEPYHGVCLRVDCTETFRAAKDHKVSVFLSMVHRSLVVANHIENFKTRVVDGQPCRFKTIHAGSAVGRSNGTICFGHYAFRPDMLDFAREASVEVERVRAGDDIERYPGQDVIRFSVLPWLDFTSISHARDLPSVDSAPRITFGKITEANGRRTMPISIHVHHGLADGEHVAQFVELLEDALAHPIRQKSENLAAN